MNTYIINNEPKIIATSGVTYWKHLTLFITRVLFDLAFLLSASFWLISSFSTFSISLVLDGFILAAFGDNVPNVLACNKLFFTVLKLVIHAFTNGTSL